MSDDSLQLKMFVEAAILASEHPVTIDHLKQLFDEDDRPSTEALRNVLATLAADCNERGIELAEVASGFRYQVKAEFGQKINKLFEERPPRYTRAFLETLALIAYRQPITRGEIEDIRGVAVSTNIIKSLIDREWVRVVGYRDVPGRPGLYATTRQFLDYFNLKSLEQLPSLVELQNLDLLADKLEESNPELQHVNEDDVHQPNVYVELNVSENNINENAVELEVSECGTVENEIHPEQSIQENTIHEVESEQDAEEDDYIEIIDPADAKNEVNQFDEMEESEIDVVDENVSEINAMEVNEEYTHEISDDIPYETSEKFVLDMTETSADEEVEREMAEGNAIY